ncbi:beta-glucosidase [Mariniflexile fucanivorans]|uniref:Beta-glucosidase n=1 Tax=Mariniflexile fucanivorans TaxID=264023 RepID=A0A4R1RHX7_9FLAO|nr:beta-glucosidase [Mariniflexile fucanivorans]TCL65559.1 beta-glucosidase [Mariniflexile fucanivorans]
MKKIQCISLFVFLCCFHANFAQQKLPYQNTALTFEERVNDLVARMTLEEKVGQMMNNAPAISRLNIPAHEYWNECLHGVARAGKATVFPQAIGLAATFDTDLIFRSASVISDEARAKHHEALRNNSFKRYEGLTYWTPNINIFRDPRWGRGQETYGEDPYLTAQMGVNFIKGLQGDDPKYFKLVATPKHFAVHSGPEPERHFFDAITNKRDLYDTYLPAFEASIVEGKAYSIMGAYNRYMGKPCCASHELLDDILRKKWNFQGYVVSDCGAIRDVHDYHNFADSKEAAAAVSVQAGCDLNCGDRYTYLSNAVKKGLIAEYEIDVSLKRIFLARFKLGMFDPAEIVPYTSIPMSVVSSEKHRKLALETAEKSMVLLKNANQTLPLSKNVNAIAVIGPNANDLGVLLGNYNGFPATYTTPLDGIKAKVSSNTKVYYEMGCQLVDTISALSLVPTNYLKTGKNAGLQVSYYNNDNFSGNPIQTGIENTINSNWNLNPIKGLNESNFSVKVTGDIVVDVTGDYVFALEADTKYKLSIGDLEADNWTKPVRKLIEKKVTLKKGETYPVNIEYVHSGYPAKLKLLWKQPTKSSFENAIEIAKKADIVVFVGGISPSVEGEEMRVNYEGFKGGDRTNIELPEIQKKLLKELHATGKPVILVLLNGSALAVNWENENLPAIVEAWYPGELGGTAIANVLFGDYNPSGKLPVTFYKSVKDLSHFVNYSMKGRTYRYFEGETLYPFGYGLGYSKFEYKNLQLSNSKITSKDSTKVTVEITNSGNYEGDEMAQLYIKDLESNEVRPLKSLRGIQRITLKPQETKQIYFMVKPEDLSFYDFEEEKQMVEPGLFEVGVGTSSNDFIKVNLEIVN